MPNESPGQSRRSRRCLGLTTALVLCLASAASAAEDRKHLTLNGIMSATVASNGLAFVGLSGTTKAVSSGRTDGSLAFGVGFGNAEDRLGVQLTANITSLTADSGGFGFGDSGYLALKFSKRLGERPVYLGLEFDRLLPWGAAKGPTAAYDPGVRLALTWFSGVDAGGETYPLVMTIGAGNHVRNNQTDTGVFAGVGVGLSRSASASLAWSGDYLDLGLGVKVADNLFLNATLNDAFAMEDERRLTLSVTYTFNMFGG